MVVKFGVRLTLGPASALYAFPSWPQLIHL